MKVFIICCVENSLCCPYFPCVLKRERHSNYLISLPQLFQITEINCLYKIMPERHQKKRKLQIVCDYIDQLKIHVHVYCLFYYFQLSIYTLILMAKVKGANFSCLNLSIDHVKHTIAIVQMHKAM